MTTEELNIKYMVANNSKHAVEPKKPQTIVQVMMRLQLNKKYQNLVCGMLSHQKLI